MKEKIQMLKAKVLRNLMATQTYVNLIRGKSGIYFFYLRILLKLLFFIALRLENYYGSLPERVVQGFREKP